MGLILTIFTYNNDFLYKDKIIKITNIKTIMEEIDTNELNIKGKHKYIKIIGNLTNTKEIGKKETYKYFFNRVINLSYYRNCPWNCVSLWTS